MAIGQEQRKAERVIASLPATLGEKVGWTRDLSAKGIFFEMDQCCAIDGEVGFSVELEGPSGRVVLQGTGSIVRTEPLGHKMGVAVQLRDLVLATPRQH